MKELIRAIIGTLMALSLTGTACANPSTVLSQLGVRGVTTNAVGTNAANMLVATTGSGVLDVSLIPITAIYTPPKLTSMVFVDATIGADVSTAGAITYPYKTITYAISNTTNPAVYVMSPGLYGFGGGGMIITNANKIPMTFLGAEPTRTYLTGTLIFNAVTNAEVDIDGITMDIVEMDNAGKSLTVSIYNQGGLAGVNRLYTTSVVRVMTDPSVALYPPQSYAGVTNVYQSTRIDFAPTNTSRSIWFTNLLTIAKALDELSTWYFLPSGTTTGQVNYWTGTGWTNGTAGTTDDLLFGGTVPSFHQLYVSGDVTNTYTNVWVTGLHHFPIEKPVASNDTMALTYNTGTGWLVWRKYMQVATYDTNDDGIVDMAQSLLGFDTNDYARASVGVVATNAQARVAVLETNTASLAQGVAATNAQAGVVILWTNTASVVQGIAATNAQARVAVLETNTASIAQGIAATNAQAMANILVTNTASVVQGIAATNAQVRVAVLEGKTSIQRYFARNTVDSEIQVVASGPGITATVIGSGVSLSIPAGVVLISCQVRWPAAFGSDTFTLDLGTADMPNTTDANRWGGIFQAWRNDTGATIITSGCSVDPVNKSQLIITGLITSPGSLVNICRFSF